MKETIQFSRLMSRENITDSWKKMIADVLVPTPEDRIPEQKWILGIHTIVFGTDIKHQYAAESYSTFNPTKEPISVCVWL